MNKLFMKRFLKKLFASTRIEDYFKRQRFFNRATANPKSNTNYSSQDQEPSKVEALYSTFYFLSRKLNKSLRKMHNVAIVMPTRNHAIEHLLLGFVESVQEQGKGRLYPTFYNSDNDNQFLKNYIVPAVHRKQPDLILTIGADCSNFMAQSMLHRAIKTPLVFAAVHNPRQFGLDTIAKEFTTGVLGNYKSDLYANALSAIKTNMRKVGIIYNPHSNGGTTNQIRTQVQTLLEADGVQVKAITVNNAQEALAHADILLPQIDTLIVLPDHTVRPILSQFSEKCMQWHVTLYASDLYGFQDGATISFGYHEGLIGKQVAELVTAILHDNVPVGNIPIVDTSLQYQLVVNARLQHLQGLELNPRQSVLIDSTIRLQ